MSAVVIATAHAGDGTIRIVANGLVSSLGDLFVPFRDILAAFEPDEMERTSIIIRFRHERPDDWSEIDVEGDGEPVLCINAGLATGFIGVETLHANTPDYLLAFTSILASAYCRASGLGDEVRDEVRNLLLEKFVAGREAISALERHADEQNRCRLRRIAARHDS